MKTSIIYNQQQLQLDFYGIPSIQATGQAIGVKRLKMLSYSSRQTPWKRRPKYSGLLHTTEPENFEGGLVSCQNATTKNQSLRGVRSSTGAQHSNLLFKY